MFGPAGSQQLTRRHWLPLNADIGDIVTGDGHSRSQSMARADASEAKISNIFSTTQLIETNFIENVLKAMQGKSPQNRRKIIYYFFYYQTNRILIF